MIDTVYVDLHGTLVDFVGAWIEASGLSWPRSWPAGKYSLEEVFDLTPAKVWEPIQKLGSEFWSGLPPTRELLGITTLAKSLGDVRFVTSPGSPIESRCHEAFGSTQLVAGRFKSPLRIVDDKSELARPDRLLIDDSDKHVSAWRSAGGPAILVPRPWNSLHSVGTEADLVVQSLQEQLEEVLSPKHGRFVVALPLPPDQLRPNRRPVNHKAYRAKLAAYRDLCCAIIRATINETGTDSEPTWDEAWVDVTFLTQTGRAWDVDNAIATLKPAMDAFQHELVIRNDKGLRWREVKFEKAPQILNTKIGKTCVMVTLARIF